MNSRPARAQVPGQKPRLSDHLKVQFVNFFLAGRLLARSRYFLFFPGTPSPAPLQITVFSSRPVNDPTTLEFCLINVYPPSCFPAENQFLLSPLLFILFSFALQLLVLQLLSPGPSFFRTLVLSVRAILFPWLGTRSEKVVGR